MHTVYQHTLTTFCTKSTCFSKHPFLGEFFTLYGEQILFGHSRAKISGNKLSEKLFIQRLNFLKKLVLDMGLNSCLSQLVHPNAKDLERLKVQSSFWYLVKWYLFNECHSDKKSKHLQVNISSLITCSKW